MPEYVLLDADNTLGLPGQEIDDGLTLLYLLGRADIDLLGMTTVFGNGPIRKVRRATEELLEVVDRPNLPLHHGAGGAGDVETDAARFLAETVAARPGEVTVLAIGPLTNVYAASLLDPDFFANVKQVACMGGYLHPLKIGEHYLGELNLSADPAASAAVLHGGAPLTLMNGHICLQAAFTAEDLQRLDHWPAALQEIIASWRQTFGKAFDVPHFYLWDLVPAVYLSYPTLFDRNPRWIRATVEDLQEGFLRPGEPGQAAQINLPSEIKDSGAFKEILFKSWARVRAAWNRPPLESR